LLAVTAFELADGFGLMSNVYDPIDLAANAAGVALAWAVDSLGTRAAAAHRAPGIRPPARR
jgi:hypothetical protein